VARPAKQATKHGVLYFGSTTPAMHEALDALEEQGIHLDGLRLRGFPFGQEVADFVAAHDQVFVVAQNRDAQLRTLLLSECGLSPAKLTPVLHYDGTPITERFISRAILEKLHAVNVTPLRKTV
jgi:2-oxoglutarate/2-oxoacid ferredoxin oxidoreductase subunit alpha